MRRAVHALSSAFLLAVAGTACEKQQESARPAAPAMQRSPLEVELPEEELQRTLAQNPPRVEELAIQAVEARWPGSMVVPSMLTVRFAEDRELPSQIPISTDTHSLVLSSVGNNTYQAFLDFDYAELDWQYQRIAMAADEAGGSDTRVPAFQGRQLTEWVLPPAWDPEWLRAQIDEGSRIPLDEVVVGFPQLVSAPRSLFITDPGVVGDPGRTANPCAPAPGDAQKVWSFGYLMTQLANQSSTGISAAEFTRNWLEKWRYDRLVNGWAVPARDTIGDLIGQWEGASNSFILDMDKAPFRLLAIVNRIDLAENTVYGGGTGGEGRFIFAWVDEQCRTREFTVIFEYGVPVGSCLGLRSWAQRWKALDTMEPGTPQYNQALEDITEVFARAGAGFDKPNGSALNQLRTNEIALADPWQLREFRLQGGGFLSQTTVVQTPETGLNGTPELADYVNTSEAGILAGGNEVPLAFNGQSFRGGSSEVPHEGFFWNAEGIQSNEARHRFALDTCNGCHARETDTSFTHIDVGSGALSGFLTGASMPVLDPVDGTPRDFNDLAFRAARLDSIANQMCLLRIKDFRPRGH